MENFVQKGRQDPSWKNKWEGERDALNICGQKTGKENWIKVKKKKLI